MQSVCRVVASFLFIAACLPITIALASVDKAIDRRRLIGVSCLSVLTVFVGGPKSEALTPLEAESKYNIYAKTYDELDGGKASSLLGIDAARRSLIELARGNVLEIGVGTGLNLDKYDATKVTSLTLVDISDGMLQEAMTRVKSLPNLQEIQIRFVKADATSELLDLFGPDLFDTVVDTFSLCVMGKVAQRCLEQMSRVVQRDGKLLLLENSRSSNPLLGVYQDVTADVAAAAGGKGCVYNQDVASMIAATGSLKVESEQLYVSGLFRSYICTRLN